MSRVCFGVLFVEVVHLSRQSLTVFLVIPYVTYKAERLNRATTMSKIRLPKLTLDNSPVLNTVDSSFHKTLL